MVNGLSSLTLVNAAIPFDMFWAILATCPQLESLELDIAIDLPATPMPAENMQLAKLQSLKIGGYAGQALIKLWIPKLLTPSLSSLELEFHAFDAVTLEWVRMHLGRSLGSVKTFAYGKKVGVTERNDLPFPIALLQSLPGLEELRVTGCNISSLFRSLVPEDNDSEEVPDPTTYPCQLLRWLGFSFCYIEPSSLRLLVDRIRTHNQDDWERIGSLELKECGLLSGTAVEWLRQNVGDFKCSDGPV